MKKGIILLLVLAIVGTLGYVAYQFSKAPEEGSLKAISNFAIKDTASIDKIILTDTQGDTTILNRKDGYWMANEKFRIEQNPLNTMLKTIRNIRVKSEVNQEMSDNLVEQMIINNTKVAIYQNGKLSKTYYVGNPTKDRYGTFMLLETPEEGRSSKAFVMELPGHKGHLATRFFADVETWRFSGIYNYPLDQLKSVKLTNYLAPTESVTININGEAEFELLDQNGQPVSFQKGKVANYLPAYKKVHYNFFENNLSSSQKDSLKNQATPFYTVEVTDQSGTTKKVDCYKRKAYKGATDVNGNQLEYDIDRFTAIIDDETVVVCQYFVFDPLLRNLSSFQEETAQIK